MGIMNKCNFLNFVRGANNKHDIDYMLTPVREQIRLARQYHFNVTFLLQYDALIDDRFIVLINKENYDRVEIGAWFETPKQLVEAAGIKWRGREGFTWDWYNDVGFLIGYTPDERKKIIDAYFIKFKEIFGHYPEVVGSWHIDAVSLKYMSEKYHIVASCMCRDQVGTDGYTMWGGYHNAYYPSVKNMFTPAGSDETQIDVPVFRMLGSDVIYNYDHGYLNRYMGYPNFFNHPNTLEPVFKNFGANEKWVTTRLNAYLSEVNGPITYTQIGQENGFGWENIGPGLTMQLGIIKKLADEGKLSVEKFSETGKWFRDNFKSTPALVAAAEEDWADGGRKSYWYCNKGYRANLYKQGNHIWIRDIYRFDDTYAERCLETPCRTHSTIFDNLPIIDGYVWSDAFTRAGIYPVTADGGECNIVEIKDMKIVRENDVMKATLTTELGDIIMSFGKKIEITSPDGVAWQMRYAKSKYVIPKAGMAADVNEDLSWSNNIKNFGEKEISYIHNNYEYKLTLEAGKISENSDEGEILMLSESGRLILCIK